MELERNMQSCFILIKIHWRKRTKQGLLAVKNRQTQIRIVVFFGEDFFEFLRFWIYR